MPDAGNFGLTYELLFEGESAWTDITALVDSRTTKIDVAGCSEDLKSVIGKCSFEMRYNTNPSKALHAMIVGKILDAKQSLGTVRFRMGGIASFVGKIDLGSFSQRNGRIPGFPTITVEDNSYLLDEVMGASFEYPANDDLDDEGWAVFDKSNLAESIVMLRLLDAGYTIDQIDLASSDSITEKVRRVVYDADDERTYREMLDTLLYEYCAVIHTTPEGKLSVRRLYKESPVSERSVEGFLVKEGITTGGGDYAYDGVKVVWSNLSRLDGAVVYNANITMNMDDDGNREGEEIQPQHYWPEDGDIEETWQEFDATFLDREYQTKVSRLKNKDLSLISVKNAYYEVDKDAEILLANNPPEIEPTKARVLWWNSHSTDVKKLYGFTIVGDALFRSKLNESTYPADARKIDKPYETEFIYSSEAAAKLANHLHRFRKYGDLQHKWSEIGVATPLFQVVTVSAPDTLISSLGMVISQSITFPAPNKIKRSNSAIGITAFNSEPVKTRSIQLGGAPVNTGPAGSNGTRSVVQFILGTADGPYSDAGNVLGTDLALVGTSLALVGVDGAQWMYEAPTPDAGEYVWRREGYYTPPEVWPKVWNITRMTGASSFGLALHPSALTIPVSSRGVPYGGNITISAVFQNIPTTYEITWGIVGASFVDAGTNQTKVVEVDTVTSDAVIITVSVLFGGVTYTDMVTLTKVWDGKPAPVYAGVHDSMFYDIGGEPLLAGDCFLYMPKVGEAYDDTNPLFGHVLKWDGDSWESTTDSQSIGFAAKDAFQIARESGKVIFAAVIYTEAMVAANIQAGSGTGLAGSGFRFRAMDDDYSQEGDPKVPRFDAYADNVKLFEIVPSGDDYGDVTLGDYENNRGMKYDHSEHEFDVRGSLTVSDGTKNTFKALSKPDGVSNAGDVEIGDYASGKGAKYFADTGEFKAKFSEIRNVLPYTYMDSLDASHPFEIDFFIPVETVNIASIKLNAKGLKYRAYASAVGFKDAWPWGEDYWTGEATPLMSLTTGYNNGATSLAGAHAHSYIKATGTSGGSHSHGLSIPSFNNAATSTVGDWDNQHSHEYKLPSGTTSGGAHSHTISSSSDNTSNVLDHKHTFDAPNGITGGAHRHKVSISLNHSHDMTFGIYEGTTPASVSLYCDNGSGYGSAISLGDGIVLANELNLTSYFSGTGWKKIKFTSSRLGRITALLMVNVDITA